MFLGFFIQWFCISSRKVKFKMTNGQDCIVLVHLYFTQIMVQSVTQSSDYLAREIDCLLPEERMLYMGSNFYCF